MPLGNHGLVTPWASARRCMQRQSLTSEVEAQLDKLMRSNNILVKLDQTK
jgi:hypothetical protein